MLSTNLDIKPFYRTLDDTVVLPSFVTSPKSHYNAYSLSLLYKFFGSGYMPVQNVAFGAFIFDVIVFRRV